MVKFLVGVVTGVLLVFIGIFLLFFAALRFREKPPAVASNSVLVLRLSGDVPEKAPVEMPDFLGGSGPNASISGVWECLKKAAVDSHVRAVVVMPEGVDSGWAKLEEIRADLEQFRKSGKPVFAYLRMPSARDYYVALGADRIYMGLEEPLMLKGMRAEVMYFKNTLDKIGVSVEVEHAGKYKDFGDMFTRSDMSPETREVLNSMVDGLYGNLVNQVAKARKKTPDEVRAIIDRGPFTATQALKAGLVDELRFEDQMWGELKGALGSGNVNKLSYDNYSKVSVDSVGLGGRNSIALVIADGEIVRGSPGDNGSDESELTSYGFDRMLNNAVNQSFIKGIVVRIDSPGGEVTASDEIWREMNLASKKKPLVISMSDVAASGGYYMAMTGDPIVAYPQTLTGSIGVVFGKPNLRGLYQKLGISKDAVERGHNASIDSDYTPLTPEQRALLREGIDESYRDFVTKVATARKRSYEQVDTVAQGRVWLGSQGRQNGLVDELGGLDTAINMVKTKANIPASEQVRVIVYPGRRSLFDIILRRPSQEDALESRVRSIIGHVPFRAWMKPGFLRLMPFGVNFN